MYDPNEQYPIINVPENRRKLIYRVEWLVMFIATVAVWFYFIQYIFVELMAAWDMTKDMAAYLTFVFLSAMGILIYWQVFNYLMYAKKARRKAFPDPQKETVANLYGITVAELESLTVPIQITMYCRNEQYYLSVDAKKTIYLGLFNRFKDENSNY